MKPFDKPSLWRKGARGLAHRLLHWAENNDEPRPEKNGELWLMRMLLRVHVRAKGGRLPMVVFDGGANEGNYTRILLREARAAACPVEVHVFEPAPIRVDGLRRVLADEPGVFIEPAALSDHPGYATLHAGKSGSSQASLVDRPGLGFDSGDSIQVPLIRLEDYLDRRSIESVGLLKLDVEGAEFDALRGLGAALTPERVDVIQFEYGGTTADAGRSLRDLFRLLEGHGYKVAKLFPRRLEVRGYRPWMDHFSYANYVALSPRWLAAGPEGRAG